MTDDSNQSYILPWSRPAWDTSGFHGSLVRKRKNILRHLKKTLLVFYLPELDHVLIPEPRPAKESEWVTNGPTRPTSEPRIRSAFLVLIGYTEVEGSWKKSMGPLGQKKEKMMLRRLKTTSNIRKYFPPSSYHCYHLVLNPLHQLLLLLKILTYWDIFKIFTVFYKMAF